MEARISTWNNTENRMMTSYLPHGYDVNKILLLLRDFAQSTIIQSLINFAKIWSEHVLKIKTKSHKVWESLN